MRITSVVFGITIGAVNCSSASVGGVGTLDVGADENSFVEVFCEYKMIMIFVSQIGGKLTPAEKVLYSIYAKKIKAEQTEKDQFCLAIAERMLSSVLGTQNRLPDRLDKVMAGIAVLDEEAPCLRGHCDPEDVLLVNKQKPAALGFANEICGLPGITSADKSNICRSFKRFGSNDFLLKLRELVDATKVSASRGTI